MFCVFTADCAKETVDFVRHKGRLLISIITDFRVNYWRNTLQKCLIIGVL